MEKILMLGKIEGRRRREGQRMRWLDAITDSRDMSLGKFQVVGDEQGGLLCCSLWGCKESDTTEQLNTNKKIGRELVLQEKVLGKQEKRLKTNIL